MLYVIIVISQGEKAMAKRKQDSSIQVDENVNVYEGKIKELFDEFVNQEMQGDFTNINDRFLECVLYIRDRLYVTIDNTYLISRLFYDYLYICICSHVNPTVNIYYMLIGTTEKELRERFNKDFMKLHETFHDICKSFLVHDLSNSGQTAKKFIAQTVYGLTDSKPNINVYEPKIQLSNKELAAQIGILPDQTITQHDE